MSERDYWVGFSVFPGVGPGKFKKLLSEFGSAKDAWEAPGFHIVKLLGEKLTEKFDQFRNKFSIQDYARILLREGVSFVTLEDKEYPKLLKKIKNPPFLLYIKGDTTTLYSSRDPDLSGESGDGVIPDLIGNLDSRSPIEVEDKFRGNDKFSSRQARTITPTIAVVGTRKTTSYGREVTKILTEELAEAGFIIVSGLAIGVDAVSHKTTLDNNGKTIAVLGCGIDCCYPLTNQSLYNSIVAGKGLVVSEFPLGQRPIKGSFLSRNRIIAGLSMGVLVTEGAEDSGALITANYAFEFGRPVFAVPGSITSSLSKGPYKLISRGAKLVTSAKDIFKELKISIFAKASADKQNIKFKTASKEERKILEILQNEPLHFDELVRQTGSDSSKTGSLLSLMEVKGMIKALESGQFSIAS